MVEYELIDETNGIRYRNSWCRIPAFVMLYVLITAFVYFTWNAAYDVNVYNPNNKIIVPISWYRRALLYANSIDNAQMAHDFRLMKNHTMRSKLAEENLNLNVSKPLNVTDKVNTTNPMRMVCYYTVDNGDASYNLHLSDVSGELCTHINIGIASIENSTIILTKDLINVLEKEVPVLREVNPKLKLLLWVGGGGNDSAGFPEMVKNHTMRKIFIQSLKQILQTYKLDGIDLDWEFPSAYKKERQHFSQLLYEIKQEYKRERKDYLLSVAVAAPEGIALFAYDVRELNIYADHVNLMSYDYHFYTPGTPFTGLNAPLYPRSNEHSILATLNINYSVYWWLENGLDRNKLVVGLPTYGHSFTLVNPFNYRIGAPASDIGTLGQKGFASYSELCWFLAHNFKVAILFDQSTCSPFMSSALEWVSFENEKSIECKARYIKAEQLGGAMLFSLNTDDFKGVCKPTGVKKGNTNATKASSSTFPLINAVKKVLSSQ